ncbi:MULTISPECIES: EI24 domain-containing protein [unclassified Microbacterium]|uniref:EI24 domain-containing protein n=1 Tax=unclassified Microbacterium TaxID=2609290 RepID=UPI0021A71982|nr:MULTISPECIES: EI24 domain-containing protein [unclassified Microbacterium]MCT1365429.1 EI24 domain-containing protein [Microbacterium sp. p3-SID131]MCT1378413.1 EI24 domain-containing protein [Microbacterium sp. p3-SID337]
MIREFAAGVRTLFRGFGVWRTRPGLMALGLVPAIIALVLLAAVLVPLILSMPSLTAWLTPFADGWVEPWRGVLRTAVGLVVVAAALALASSVFSALTLTIGDPFYQRIWHAVEKDLGDPPPADGGSFWTTVGEGLRLVVLGILIALLVLLIGLVPGVGGVLGAVSGVVLTGRLLARELTGRAFDARDLSPAARAALFSGSRARVLGFGVATQLCFLIPGGAVAVMPAAVAGSTMLARDMQARTPLAAVQPTASAAVPHDRTPGIA